MIQGRRKDLAAQKESSREKNAWFFDFVSHQLGLLPGGCDGFQLR
jgi:hypothetical protein